MIVQARHYYSFGMEMSQLNNGTTINKYQYNGKEIQDDFGLYWYDYGARFYDPELGRFHTIDPASESLKSWSPYSYTLNNPIKYIDPDGEFPIIPPGAWAAAGAWLAEKGGAMNRLLTGTSGNINAPQGMVPESTQRMSKIIGTTQDATTLAEAPIEIAQGTAEFTSDVAPVVGGTLMLAGYVGAPFSGGATLPLVPIGGKIMAVGGAIDMVSDFNKGNYESVAIDLSINAIFGGLGKGIRQLKNADKLNNADEAILNFFKDLSKATSDELKNQVEKKVNEENTNDYDENNR